MGLPAEAAPVLDRYCDHLQRAIELGFLGPREADRLVERHILESAALAQVAPEEGLLVDVGPGAGLPGVVLAALRVGPTILVEADGRRCRFLGDVIADLGVEARVVHSRAEAAGRDPLMRDMASVATARALAPPAAALELTLPFVRPEGLAIVLCSCDFEAEETSHAVLELGATGNEVIRLDAGAPGAHVCGLVARKVTVTPERYPRRDGVPTKRPLTA